MSRVVVLTWVAMVLLGVATVAAGCAKQPNCVCCWRESITNTSRCSEPHICSGDDRKITQAVNGEVMMYHWCRPVLELQPQ